MTGVANLLDLFRRISFRKLKQLLPLRSKKCRPRNSIVTQEFVRTESPKAQRVVVSFDEQKQMEVRVP